MDWGVPAALSQEIDPDVFAFMQSMQPPAQSTWVEGIVGDGDLLDAWANFFAGMGDAISFNVTNRVREWAGINGGIDPTGAMYIGGQITGTVVNVGLTGGAGLARTPAVARMMVRAYTATDIAVARVRIRRIFLKFEGVHMELERYEY